MASLAAVHGLTEVEHRLVTCLGFGVDAHHGVNHVLVLENLAALERDGAYLGAFSLPRDSREGALYLDAVAHARSETPSHPASLFVNPLMALYFSVDAVALAERNLHLDRLEKTHLTRQISSIIEAFREEPPRQRAPRMFPHRPAVARGTCTVTSVPGSGADDVHGGPGPLRPRVGERRSRLCSPVTAAGVRVR